MTTTECLQGHLGKNAMKNEARCCSVNTTESLPALSLSHLYCCKTILSVASFGDKRQVVGFEENREEKNIIC